MTVHRQFRLPILGRLLGREHATGLLAYLSLIVAWQCLSYLELWPKVLFPSPIEVGRTAVSDILSGTLFSRLLVSLWSLGIGFVISIAVALPIAYFMGLHRTSREFFDPLINLVQAIPGLAWIPFGILWFGLGQGAVLFIVVMSIFFPIVQNTLTGIKMVHPVLIDASRTLGAGRLDIIRHVVFPATLPNLITGVRLGIAFGFRSLVGGEMIASTDGIGYFIFNAQQYFQSSRIVVGMLAIGVTWLMLDRLVLRPIERRTVMRWGLMREGAESS